MQGKGARCRLIKISQQLYFLPRRGSERYALLRKFYDKFLPLTSDSLPLVSLTLATVVFSGV